MKFFPVKNWHSGIAILEDKKYNFVLKDTLLVLLSKKQKFAIEIEINEAIISDTFEFCALLFGTLRVMAKSYKAEAEPVLG